MKILKRIVIISLTLAFLTGGISQVSAATYTRNSSGRSFKKAWSTTPINTANQTFKYGYNTLFFNEYYTHTYHRNKKHEAYVKNERAATTKKAKPGKYAKAEIIHKGTVFYSYSY